MQRTILITGSTDGIGLEAAKMLAAAGHEVLLHGRSRAKLDAAAQTIAEQSRREGIETFVADLARLDDVKRLVGQIVERSAPLDVLINNAGILKAPEPITASGMDIRFVVNTLAPYLLAKQLMPVMNPDGRIVNVSSAAQASVQPEAMMGRTQVGDMAAYAQSKLALTMWSRQMAEEIGPDGPAVIAVNPGSLLASKMVKEGFGVAGNDLSIGAEILTCAAISDDFKDASGRYFDNDAGRFGSPHRDALDPDKVTAIVRLIEETVA